MIVLVGAPGAGKSTVGQAIADRLGVPFTDVDDVIEARENRPISDIFATDGEAHFRALEVAETLALLDGEGVLALGGGAVMSVAIRDALRTHQVVWLRVSATAAADRVGLNVARPLLLGNVRGRLRTLLAERLPLYEEVATVTVDTDHRDTAEVTQAILAALEGSSHGDH